MTTRTLLLVPFLFLPSCIQFRMHEITARNNGAKFWLSTPVIQIKHYDYFGPVDQNNRAHGHGTYKYVYAPSSQWQGSGKFIHGQPDGDHRFDDSLVAGFQHYSNGQYLGHSKTRNDMPMHLLNVAVAGATSYAATRNTNDGKNIAAIGTSSTNITANYPQGYAYNVTTYTGQYASDRWSFTTTYGMTTKQAARNHLEAGKAVYGGDTSERPGWFWIEEVPVRKGSSVRTGVVGIR